MKLRVGLMALCITLMGCGTVQAASASRTPAKPAAVKPASWTYDNPIGPNIDTSAADCSLSGTTGDTYGSYTDNLSLSGTGDQSATINNAISYVQSHYGGGAVVLPPGTWTIDSPIDVLANIFFAGYNEGSGTTGTTLKAGSTFLSHEGPLGGYPMVYTDGQENVTVAYMTLDAQGQTLNYNSKSGRSNEMMLEDVDSYNVLFYNVETEDPASYSIGEIDAPGFCFSGDTTQVNTSGLYNQLDGFHMTNGSDGDVTDDYADQCNGTDGDDAIALQAFSGSVSDINIYNNAACSASANALRLAETDSTDTISSVQADANYFFNSPGGVSTGYFSSGHSINAVDIDYNEFSGVTLSPGVEIDAPPSGTVTNTLVEYNCGAASWVLASGIGNVLTGNTASC